MADERDTQNVTDAGTPPPSTPAPVQDSSAAPAAQPAAAAPTAAPAAQPQASAAQPQAAKPAAAAPANQPPQHHTIFRSIFDALAGPSYSYKVDPTTQKMVRVPVDRSKRQLADSIVAGALTGLFAGAGERGPGAELRAFAKGGAASAQRNKAIDEEGQAQASADYARRQGTIESNMRMMSNAIDYGRKTREDHDSMVNSFTGQLQDYKDNSPDMIKGEHMSEEEAADVQKNSAFDLLRIPDGTVPRIGKDGKPVYMDTEGNIVPEGTMGAHQLWDNTYTMVDKNAKTSLSDENGPKPWVKEAVDKWSGVIPGANPSLLAGNGAKGQVSAYVAGRMSHQVLALDSLQKELDQFVGRLNENNKDGKVPNVDLKKAIQNGTLSLKDVEQWQRYAGQSTQPDLQIDAMRQGQHATEAGRITALFNSNGDHLEDFKQLRDARKAQKIAALKAANVENENDAKYVLAHADQFDEKAIKAANTFLDAGVDQSAQRAQAEQEARNAADAEYTSQQDAKIQGPDHIDLPENYGEMSMQETKEYLKSKGVPIPANFEALYNVGLRHADDLNKVFPTRVSRGTNQVDAAHALTYISKYINPTFNNSDFRAAQEFNTKLANPQTSPLTTAGVATQHLELLRGVGQALQNGDLQLMNKIAQEIGVQTGNSVPVVFKAIADQVNTEVGKVVAGGAPHEAELAKLSENLHTAESPKQIEDVLKGYTGLMSGRLSQLNFDSNRLLSRDLKVNPRVTALFRQYGYETPWVKRPAIPQGAKYVNDAHGSPIGYSTDGKTYIPFPKK